MMKKLILLCLVLSFFGRYSFAQNRWSMVVRQDSTNTSLLTPIDANKVFLRVYGIRNSQSFAHWLSSSQNWDKVNFEGVANLGKDQFSPILRVSAPNRIYGYIAGNGPASGIIISKDTGRTWSSITSSPDAPNMGGSPSSFTVTPENKAFYYRLDSMALMSYDGCKTFIRKDDSLFRCYIGGSSANNSYSVGSYDFTHWTIALAEHTPPKNEPGLRTLVTSNDGKTWEYHRYLIPGHEDNVIYGTLQSIHGTSNVFYVPGANGGSSALASHPYETRLGISFLFSSDYGVTWSPNYSFGHQRRGFFAVSDKDIWMTVSSKDTLFYNGIADWIVHSTDGGMTWNIDSTTLNIQDLGVFDGKYLSFYDKGHGWLSAMNNGNGYVFRFVDTSKTSVEEIEHSLNYVRQVFKIYPNPSSDKVNLLVGTDKQILSIRLHSILGKEHIPPYTLTKSNEAVVDLQNVPSGMYLVKLQNQYRTYTLPMVVTKSN